ncbi:hypothetical protein BC937DRAFT_88284 [Endogone sp. FLAS-F59071]|nr:hypothetical protein BC937DRAFT_88284 [Endogone sp. FLAS-F59071]|eukprot:RUS18836.1 hypothetical protein BC937DRAFT_88284 [Endogone sp. FLAS-F59071]
MPNMSRPPPRRHGEGDRIVTPVRFLNYGPFSSFGPTMDSYQANISYEDTAYVADILRQKRADKMERARRRAEAAAAAAAEKQAALGVVSGSGNGSKSGSGNKSGSGGSSGGSTSVAEEKVQKAPEKGEDDAAPLDVEGKILSGKDNSGSGEDVVAMEIDGVDGMEKTDKANEVMELAKVTEATEAAEAAEAAVIMDKGKGKEKEKEKEKEEALDTGANADADAIKDNVPSDAAVSTESVEPAAVAVDTEWLKGLGLDAELILKGIEELNHEDNNDKLDGPDLAEVLQQNTEQLMELVRLQEERFSRLKGWDISWREKETANNLHKQLALLTSKIPPNLVASPQAIETAMARIPYKETAYRGSLPPNRPFAFLSNIARPEAVPSNATAQPSYPLSHPHSKPVAIPPINYAKYPVHGTTYASAQGATPASTPVSTPAPHTAQAGPSTPTPTPMMPATRSRRGSMSGTQTPTSTNPLTQPVASYPSTPNQFYHMASSQSGMTSSQQYLQQQQASQQQAAMHPLQMSSQQSRHHHQQQQQQQYQQSYPTTPQQHSAYQDYTPTTTAQNQPAYSPAATPSYPVSNGMTTPQRTQPAAAVTPVQYAPSLAPPQQSPQVRQSSPQPYGLAYDQDALMLDPNGRNRWRTAVDGQGCANCGATKTPIWRAGSNGDKLCNGMYGA